QRLATADLPTEVDHRAGPPYFPLHAEVFQVAADVNRRRLPNVAGPVQVWTTDPFEPFPAIGPVPEDRETDADVEMCLDDREQVLVRLCNIGETEVSARLRVPEQPEEAPRVTVREVKCIHPGGVEMLKGDPLPLADMTLGTVASMTLPPGLMGGWWLQIDSGGARPGLYRLPLMVTQGAGPPVEVEVHLRVLPVELPPEKPIVTWNYSYESYWIMPQRWEDARRDLVEHHINAYCWPHPYLPWLELDEEGGLQPLDWSRFDAGLGTHDNIQWLLLWPGFEWEDNLRLKLDLEPGSEGWREVFVAWFTAMREGLAERGFGPEQVAWYLSDEPCNMQRATAVKLTGEVIREIAPDAHVLANPYSAATQELLDIMDPVVNLWCPELSFASGERLEFFRQGSEILWSYQVLGKSRDPFESYRLGFWDCWDRGITGQGFWCYADAGGSAWDPWDAERHDYAPVYDGDERELIPSIRWEAWREGVEDYTLLAMVAEALEGGECPEAARRAGRRALEAADEAVAERSPRAVASARRQALLALRAVTAR
ncbi:MAG: DUF4091 domain-containing protein, partial [Armatimonadota bacterium]|nr:DUF4091 domain-containing protein [Armatimonadota bacterium]